MGGVDLAHFWHSRSSSRFSSRQDSDDTTPPPTVGETREALSLFSADELCFDTRTCLGVHQLNLSTGELFSRLHNSRGNTLRDQSTPRLSHPRSAGGGMWKTPFWRMFLSIVRSLLLLSARLESGGGTAFRDSIPCLWTTAVPSLQRQMLSVLPLWFRLQSKQETQRLTNRAPAWTSQTRTTTAPLKCTTALSPGKWKVNHFVGHRAAVACIHFSEITPVMHLLG